MSMVTGIAAASISYKSSKLMMDVNVALMGKTMDVAREQGQAIQEMMESAAPAASSVQLLDVYA